MLLVNNSVRRLSSVFSSFIWSIIFLCTLPEASAEEALTGEQPIKALPPLVRKEEKQRAMNDATKVEPHDQESQIKLPKQKGCRPTLALALGGGGARGAAHIGVLRVLKRAGINVDCIVGNSMGAVVGGLYATGLSLDEIQTLLENKSLRKAYAPNPVPVRVLTMPLSKIVSSFTQTYAGIWSGNKYQKFLEKVIPQDMENFNALQVPFYAVATNLTDGKAYAIHSGDLASAIHASSAFPPVLRPVQIDGRLYVDGGVRANLPAYEARRLGANIVLAVNVDEPIRETPVKRFRSLKGVATRITDIMLAVNDEHQLQFVDMAINPDVSNIPILSGKPKDVKRAVKAGELAAERALPALKQMLSQRSATAIGLKP